LWKIKEGVENRVAQEGGISWLWKIKEGVENRVAQEGGIN
jgi:hypothetical protein